MPFFESLCQAGFGHMSEKLKGGLKVLYKRKWEDLEEEPKELAKKLKVDEEKYQSLFD